jgi:hypothetical protein
LVGWLIYLNTLCLWRSGRVAFSISRRYLAQK